MEAQIRALKEHCEKNNIADYELFTDENVSGAKVSRPSLDRMMLAVRSGQVDGVICYSFSRFARSTTHLLSALEEMKKYNTEFISITERIETCSPMGRAFFTVIARKVAAVADETGSQVPIAVPIEPKQVEVVPPVPASPYASLTFSITR